MLGTGCAMGSRATPTGRARPSGLRSVGRCSRGLAISVCPRSRPTPGAQRGHAGPLRRPRARNPYTGSPTRWSIETMNAPLPESIRKTLESASLDDKYSLDAGRAFMSGVQALVRLPMLQRQRDAAAGLNTGGFISGYRGSPLGTYDQALWAAKKHLAANHIVFQPGVNEELGATAVWGTQQLDLYPQSKKYDGVFGIWYGKGPGVDRCSDVFKHANMAGTVQAWRRDRDRRRRPHRQEQHRSAPERPYLQGLRAAGVLPERRAGHSRHGAARLRDEPLRRRCGRGMKTIQEVVESSPQRVSIDPDRVDIVLPAGLPDAGRRAAHPLARRRAGAGSAADGLQVVRRARLRAREQAEPQRDFESSHDRFGIIASGKAYNDTRQALMLTWVWTKTTCKHVGRAACTRSTWCGRWRPRSRATLHRGLQEILVVEEKRQVIEYQLKEELYNWRRRCAAERAGQVRRGRW